MTAHRPQVRYATTQDTAEIIRLASLMYESIDLDASTRAWQEAARAAITERLGDGVAIVVAEHPSDSGSLVASGAGSICTRLPGPANLSGRVGYIQWVATAPEWRKQGLAREILTTLLDWYRQEGIVQVELHATTDGEPLYRSLGFGEGNYPGMKISLRDTG
ncbi:GNAT family N-acetyltransferase [Haloechinothrix sp. YIM 98757]|uniref:GNAT family N-acetyltransferase n=1 Tax=Haloechinothrix aidingensis TaxID=2752311 RepID=A0A838A0D7_9PSEU|nr:GNAT family N-acetyltransferase [Haloechinothrix aidingensis]MBA0124543.1 GNAT family N-acetyltransferase [Haloechinothrix aidingensis]